MDRINTAGFGIKLSAFTKTGKIDEWIDIPIYVLPRIDELFFYKNKVYKVDRVVHMYKDNQTPYVELDCIEIG